MPFRNRFIVSGRVNGKFYFHTGGRELYGQTNDEQTREAIGLLRGVFTRYSTAFQDQTVLLGALWGDIKGSQKVVDIFGLQIDGEWPGNPEVRSWVSREGNWPVRENEISCLEGGRLLLGAEGELLASSPSLAVYLETEIPMTQLILNGSETHHIKI